MKATPNHSFKRTVTGTSCMAFISFWAMPTAPIQDPGPQAVASMIAGSPMKRLGLADEVAHLVTWLCTEASRYNTGAVFDMSGGRARY